jgi:uncharacterized Zn finger protein
MEVNFECECGHDVTDFTRGGASKSATIECTECGAVWTVTLTNIRSGNTDSSGTHH